MEAGLELNSVLLLLASVLSTHRRGGEQAMIQQTAPLLGTVLLLADLPHTELKESQEAWFPY